MTDNIDIILDKTYYVRSKIGNYPLSHNILPVPNGMSAVIFKNNEDIDEYYKIREIDDFDNLEILPVISFYDFMRSAADLGFAGIWFFNNFPILFGNYVSDIDSELPSFAYTFHDGFIGASGIIDQPKNFIPWENFQKTDKIIRRFVKFPNGLFFTPKDELFTIVCTDQNKFEKILTGGREHIIRYCRFPDASPLQGAYVSGEGAYCLFTDEESATRYLLGNILTDKTLYKIEKIDNLISFLEIISVIPLVDIGINPGNERFYQGYILGDQRRGFVKMVLGMYEITDDLEFRELEFADYIPSNDTIETPNTIDSFLRGIQSTIMNPLKNKLGSTKSSLPRRESDNIINKLITESKYINYPDENYVSVKSEDISSDSFLMFGFDKIANFSFCNNDEGVTPYVFSDIVDAILYFYHSHFLFECELRIDGYFDCQANAKFEGTQDEEKEHQLLSEHRQALRDLMEIIFTDGYRVEHAGLLRSYINRSTLSLEMQACGYLGDLAIYDDQFVTQNAEDLEDSDILKRINKIAKGYKDKFGSRIVLDERCQNQIRIYLGSSYENVSMESRCILESAIKQFESINQSIYHDYAGISMKLCKVFERELNILIFQKWRKNVVANITKPELKILLKDAEEKGDETTRKLVGWLLKRNKLELGPMSFIIKRIKDQCDSEILTLFREYILTLTNSNYILSEDFLAVTKKISTRYRNGGVHEKIVTYDICKEAFENILMIENNYIKELANI